MGFSLDLRKVLRAVANRAQDENAERLLRGAAVGGGTIDPRKSGEASITSRARVRIFGVRVKLRELAGKVGVATGAMLRDLTRRSNIKLGKLSFRIGVSPEIRARWFVFNAGDARQPARPVSGMSDALIRDGADQCATAARDQAIAAMNRRPRGR